MYTTEKSISELAELLRTQPTLKNKVVRGIRALLRQAQNITTKEVEATLGRPGTILMIVDRCKLEVEPGGYIGVHDIDEIVGNMQDKEVPFGDLVHCADREDFPGWVTFLRKFADELEASIKA